MPSFFLLLIIRFCIINNKDLEVKNFMKVLHTADIHLGVKINKLDKDKSALMKEEQIYNIKEFFKGASDYDVVLICGDLFHSKNITAKIERAFFDGVRTFGKPVLYVEGNHDNKTPFQENLPENFIILDEENNVFSLNGVNFYTKSDITNINHDQSNILLLHGNIDNTGDNDYINIDKFLDLDFDYIALGHIHQYKRFNLGKTILAYPGSLFSNGFDECGQKGFISFDIEDKEIKDFQFVPFIGRKFIICNCDITGLYSNTEIINKISLELNNLSATKNDIIRVILNGKSSEDSEKSLLLIKDKFNSYFHFEIVDNSTFNIDFEKIKSEKLSFKYEFIKLVEESQLSDEQKKLICQLGIEALKGEDLSI